MNLSGWGRFPLQDCNVALPRSEADLQDLIAMGGVIARGNGRAYGDSALGRRNTADMRAFNRMLAFDPERGQLTVEAGVLLEDIIAAFLPRGWFPAVTPGTKFVTVGGMAAADVHGKNHHKDGSFGAFIDWMDVMGPDGRVRRCGGDQNHDLFGWTLGGMGLTGVILRMAFRLRPVETAWIRQTTIPTANLRATMEAIEAHGASTYSVAWIDCLSRGEALGRSLVLLGEHAMCDDLPEAHCGMPFAVPRRSLAKMPVDLPSFALNRFTVRAFNELYFRGGRRRSGHALVDWDRYFYPLDAVAGWNRLYGRRGLVQFQCVLPPASSREGLEALLTATSRAGQGSFLAVLKRFGAEAGPFSFPRDGYTLALDFPVTRRSLALLSDLDRIAIAHGGRFYLAKDSRMPAETLRLADPRVDRFREMRESLGSRRAFASLQSERLQL